MIDIDTDGTVTMLFREELEEECRIFGELTVQTASTVEYSPQHRKWEVVLRDGTLIGRFDTRQEGLDAEVRYLQDQMKAQAR